MKTKATTKPLFREAVRNGEALALRAGFDFMSLFCEPIIENYEVGEACVVTVHGPMDYHDTGMGESYEAIRARFEEALESSAKCVVLRLDTPGGVVSGLNQTVFAMQKAKAASGKPVLVYVDETAASAGYALACVGDEIILPPSGIVGSIGVISHMIDATQADKSMGLKFTVIASGSQKTDGHEHVTTTDDAISRERKRVARLASQFFNLVKKARGVDPAPFEAGVFLGKDAVSNKLADDIMGWDEFLSTISSIYNDEGASRSAPSGQQRDNPTRETSEMLKLTALIAQTKKALAAEKNAGKRASLTATLKTYQATAKALKTTKYKLEEEETTEGEEEEAPDSSGELPPDPKEEDAEDEASAEGDEPPADDDKDKKAKKAKAKKALKAEDESEDADAESEESEEEATAQALYALVGKTTGAKGAALMGRVTAMLDKAKGFDALQGDVRALKAAATKRAKLALIGEARRAVRITKTHAHMLESKDLAFVKSFLEMHKSPMVALDGDELQPDDSHLVNVLNPFASPVGAAHGLSAEQMQIFHQAANASGGSVTVEQLVADYQRKQKAASNGAGRY